MSNLLEIRKLILSHEKILKEEIFNLMNKKYLKVNNIENEKIVITFGISNESDLFKNVDFNVLNIYDVIDKDDLLSKKLDLINSMKSKILAIIFDENTDLELLKNLKDRFNLIYFSKGNYFFENIDHIKDNKILNEKNISDFSDLIVTCDIDVYNYKVVLENRFNVYFINGKDEFSLNYVISNFSDIDRETISNSLKKHSELVKDRYEKLLFLISSQAFDTKSCLELCEYGYKKYNTKELFNLYLFLLAKSKDYMKLVSICFNSDYLDDIYKAEIIYLESTKCYDLLEFLVDILVNNLNSLDFTTNNNYKLAFKYMVLNDFSSAYFEYDKILNNNDCVLDSPLINKNMYYILKSKNDENYNYYYDRYNLLKTECLSTYYNGDK